MSSLRASAASLARLVALVAPALFAATEATGSSGDDDAGPAPAEAAPRVPLVAPLSFGGRYLGDLPLEVEMGGDAWAVPGAVVRLLDDALSAAERARMLALGDAPLPLSEIGGQSFAIGFDMSLLEVRAEAADADALSLREVLVAGGAPPDPARGAKPSRFAVGANLFAAAETIESDLTDDAEESFFAAAELQASFGGFGGLVATSALERDPDGGLRTRDTRLVRDRFENATRLQGGEVVADAVGFQDSAELLGVSFARRYADIRPFQNVRPAGRREIVIDRPSSVQVLVNGILVDTLSLPPGRYAIDDLPLEEGSNDIELLVEDATGRVERISYVDVFRPRSLAAGLTDFSVALGVRSLGDLESTGSAVATGHYARGLAGGVTLGVNAQASSRAAQLGGTAILGGRFGDLGLRAAASVARDGVLEGAGTNDPDGFGGVAGIVDPVAGPADPLGPLDPLGLDDTRPPLDVPDAIELDGTVAGHAIGLDYVGSAVVAGRELSVVATADYATERFAGFLDPVAPRRDVRASASVGAVLSLPRAANLALFGLVSDGRSATPDRVRYGANVSVRRGRVGLSLGASRTEADDGDDWQASLRVSVPLGRAAGASFGATALDGGTDTGISFAATRSGTAELYALEASLSVEADTAASDDGELVVRDARAEAGWIANRADVDLSLRSIGASDDPELRETRLRLGVGTALGYSDGAFGVGRRFSSGFAIVERHRSLDDSVVHVVDGARNVAEIGRHVPTLVPLGRAYSLQRRAYDVEGAPLGYDIGAGGFEAFPDAFDGYRVRIGSAASRTVLGRLHDADGEPVALGTGELRPETGDPIPWFTNRGGRFVAERVAPGTYALVLRGVVVGEVVVDDAEEGMVDVGTVTVARR